VPPEAGELAAQLDDLAGGLNSALDELRELARGVHPAILAAGGLRPALKQLARRCSVPVRLDMRVVGRLPESIEIAAYYVVSEALANAAKHAHATVIDIDVVVNDDVLRIRVHDDGRGGTRLDGGTGLLGLRDRVETLGGRLRIQSPAGAGTTVEAELPHPTTTR
jgi:signal transduction histidine kinase